MRKAIKDSKWYWYISLLWLYFLPTMSKWTLEEKDGLESGWRLFLIEILMFPTIITGFLIVFYIRSLI